VELASVVLQPSINRRGAIHNQIILSRNQQEVCFRIRATDSLANRNRFKLEQAPDYLVHLKYKRRVEFSVHNQPNRTHYLETEAAQHSEELIIR
jgi:hypothetical protein